MADATLDDILAASKTDKAPKPPAGERKSHPKPKKAQLDNLEQGFSTVLALGSMGAGMLAPKYWPIEDWLSQEECDDYAKALVTYLEACYPGALYWLVNIDKASPHIAFAMATMAIAAPRLKRRKMVPGQVADMMAGAGDFLANAQLFAQTMATGGAPGADRTDTVGEVDPGDLSAAVSQVSPGVSEQDGPGETAAPLSGADGGEDVEPNPASLSEIFQVGATAEV